MKEIRKIIEAFEAVDWQQQKAAMATVVKVRGSSYRRPGARMFITGDGHWTGAISGGCLEGDALRRARQVMDEGKPRLITYDTMNDAEAESMGIGLGCNGIIDVLIEPVDNGERGRWFDAMKKVISAQQTNKLATIMHLSSNGQSVPGGKAIILNGVEEIFGDIPRELAHEIFEILHASNDEKSEIRKITFKRGEAEVLFEMLKPNIKLYLFGGGYDINPLISIAKNLDWKITVSNDCHALAVPKRFPLADHVEKVDRQDVGGHFHFDEYSAVVLMSHNYKFDLAVMTSLMHSPLPAYLGILGPRKRFEKIKTTLLDAGFTRFPFHQVCSPAGLDLGAETPDEIALSLVAEIQAVMRGKHGGQLREKQGFIHDRVGEKDLTFSL